MNIKHSSIILLAISLLLIPLLLFITFWLSYFFIYWMIILYILKDLLPFVKNHFTETLYLSPKQFFTTCSVILLWVIYGGIGKIGYQNFDYVKHNSIFYDLMMNSWPVETSLENNRYYLVYYLGYYLLPAGLGKIFNSFLILEIISIIQAFMAIFIVLLLIMVITKHKNVLIILLAMVLWGGLDLMGDFLFQQDYSHRFGEFPEWWAGASNFQYTGFTDLLYWVPQHALGGWLTTTLCFVFFQRRLYLYLPFFVALSLLWSPFVCIGLSSFLVVAFFSYSTIKEKIEWIFSRYGNFALLILFVLMSYYATSSFQQPFQWQFIKMGAQEFTLRYISFLLIEISIPCMFIFFFRKKISHSLMTFFLTSLIFLILTPHIYLGVYSDFAMRGSIVGLFSLFILSVLVFRDIKDQPWAKIMLFLWLSLTSYSALSDFYRAQKLKHITLDYGPTKVFDPNGISKQYLGLKESLFFKFFFQHY